MKPKRLSFCGINSFSKTVTIDFDRLLSGGIFGIFGDTGSGKTTILDSMIFALYGRVDRIRGGTANEIINYNCERAFVVFDFETETHEGRKIFRIEREIKRKNSAQSLTLSEIKGERILPISDGVRITNEKIEGIVGLTFEDFKKCIALPQGEFAQFVKAERGERLKLISRLFGLDKYGEVLAARIREKLNLANEQISGIDGELRAYDDATEDRLKEIREDVKQLSADKFVAERERTECSALYEKQKAEYDRAQKYAEIRRKLEEMLTQSERIASMKGKLEKYAAAQEALRLSVRFEERRGRMNKARQTAERISAQRAEAAQKLAILQEQFNGDVYDKKIQEAEQELSTILKAASAAEILNGYKQQRAECGKKYREAAEKKARSERRLQEVAARERILEEERKNKESIPALFLADNLDSVLLAEEFSRELEYYADKQKELHDRFLRSELFDAVDKEIASRIKYFHGRLAGEKTGDVAVLLEKWKEIQQQNAIAEKRLRDIVSERAKAEKEAEQAEKDLASAMEEGSALKNRITECERRICDMLGTAEYPDLVQMQNAAEIKKSALANERRVFERRLQECREILMTSEKELALAEKEYTMLTSEAEDEEPRLKKFLAQAGFAGVNDAQELLREIPDEKIARDKISEYEKTVFLLQEKLQTIEKEGNIAACTETELFALAERKKEVERAFSEAEKQLAVREKELEQLVQRSKRRNELFVERGRLAKKRDLTAKLRDLVRGNGLTEFVAGEYLTEISSSATRTLLKLTGGRYFVSYKDGGFLIGDNLCGGEQRSVNTLSGGETFLVSLSLALALSEAIHAKSLRPIEFFFLDEGFGTLDEKLIDTVMDSLEKLRSSHFSIGLISHVEELKHRISNKIMVTGAADGGSSDICIISD